MNNRPAGGGDGIVTFLLRAEGAATLGAAVLVWGAAGGNWLLFPLLLLVPDLSVIGYLRGPRVGAIAYNLVHNFVVPLMLALAGWWYQIPWLFLAGSLLLAHVGLDRMLGYGLKYPTAFTDTHLGRIGRRHVEPEDPPADRE